MVRLSAGRVRFSILEQAFCFLAGANSIFIGEKLLTTPNNDYDADQLMFKLLGLISKAPDFSQNSGKDFEAENIEVFQEILLGAESCDQIRTDSDRIKMFTRMFGKPKQETNALATLDKLNETLEMLEKKENVLQKKAAVEVEKAKEFTRAKNKRAAIQCLKRKRLYEQQIEQLGNFQLRIHDQMILLEGAKATTETVDALRTGAAAMKAMQKATNIDDVDKTMDEINEQTENMKQIQEALATPIGAAADFDEDELEAELEELEGAELEEQLLQPTIAAPAAPVQVQAGRVPAQPKRTKEEEELAALQAEMAL
ncbi:vacuolar protein sorting-associated protein 32-like protein 2 [Forsythia ovata]|uniref:Vacuolar protein sorting-associated protein 32-like protein 2 n=1 Tax=Forsythia ovata TaxID=205694 RepID=A0ABD1WWZ6_9LAMI